MIERNARRKTTKRPARPKPKPKRAARYAARDTAEAALLVDLGARLRLAREARGLSLRGLGERSGVAWIQIHEYEHGRVAPSVLTLAALARVLGPEAVAVPM